LNQDIESAAAEEIYQAVANYLPDTPDNRPETAVAGLAAVAGEQLLRAGMRQVDWSGLAPGTVVLCQEVDVSGPKLLAFLKQLLTALGVQHTGRWERDIPAENLPQGDPLLMAAALRPTVEKIFQGHGIELDRSAAVTARALALLIRDCRGSLEPEVAGSIAVQAMVRASKTVPLTSQPVLIGQPCERPLLSRGARAAIAVGGLFFAGLTAYSCVTEPGIGNLWARWGLALFCVLLSLACLPGVLGSFALRLVAAVISLASLSYLIFEAIFPDRASSRSDPSLQNAIRCFVVFGLPFGALAIRGYYPKWGRYGKHFGREGKISQDETKDERRE